MIELACFGLGVIFGSSATIFLLVFALRNSLDIGPWWPE